MKGIKKKTTTKWIEKERDSLVFLFVDGYRVTGYTARANSNASVTLAVIISKLKELRL